MEILTGGGDSSLIGESCLVPYLHKYRINEKSPGSLTLLPNKLSLNSLTLSPNELSLCNLTLLPNELSLDGLTFI